MENQSVSNDQFFLCTEKEVFCSERSHISFLYKKLRENCVGRAKIITKKFLGYCVYDEYNI